MPNLRPRQRISFSTSVNSMLARLTIFSCSSCGSPFCDVLSHLNERFLLFQSKLFSFSAARFVYKLAEPQPIKKGQFMAYLCQKPTKLTISVLELFAVLVTFVINERSFYANRRLTIVGLLRRTLCRIASGVTYHVKHSRKKQTFS